MNIPIALFVIIMAAMTAVYVIIRFRNNKLKLLKLGTAFFGIILALITISNVYASSRMPIILKTSESYIVDYNEIKSVSGTDIKLKKVFLDLNSINATYSVKGREKVVGIELKKNPHDITPIKDVAGLWVGGNALSDHEFIGMGYDSKEFAVPLYLVFYLSNGDSAAFEITDRANASAAVRIVDIGEKIEYKDDYITFTSFSKGLNYSSVAFESNFNPRGRIEVKLILDGVELEQGPSGWSGSSTHYQGSFGFDPIDGENVQIKVVNPTLNREDIIAVSLK